MNCIVWHTPYIHPFPIPYEFMYTSIKSTLLFRGVVKIKEQYQA